MGTEKLKKLEMAEILRELFQNEKLISNRGYKNETESAYVYSIVLSACVQGRTINDWVKYLSNLDKLTAQSHNLHTVLLSVNCTYTLTVQDDNFILDCEIDKDSILNNKSLFGYLTNLYDANVYLQPQTSCLFVDTAAEEFVYITDCIVCELEGETEFESMIECFEDSIEEGLKAIRPLFDFNYDLNTSKVFSSGNGCVRIESKIGLNSFPGFLVPDMNALQFDVRKQGAKLGGKLRAKQK